MSAETHHHLPNLPFDLSQDIPLAVFVGQMWWYAFTVLYPAQALKSTGWYPRNEIGQYPPLIPFKGEGQFYCHQYRTPYYLQQPQEDSDPAADFDRIASLYETYVRPFTQPVYEETVKLMQPFLVPTARILDISCGPGTEMLQLTELVPEGEVVGIDLSAGMVAAAFEKAQRQGGMNTAFFQADVAKMPEQFEGGFDAVYCSFAFHHYPDPLGALKEIFRVLNDQGKVFVVDPGSSWFNTISAPFANWADPGWVSFHTGEEFRILFQDAGFSHFYWDEVLPGIGVCIGSK